MSNHIENDDELEEPVNTERQNDPDGPHVPRTINEHIANLPPGNPMRLYAEDTVLELQRRVDALTKDLNATRRRRSPAELEAQEVVQVRRQLLKAIKVAINPKFLNDDRMINLTNCYIALNDSANFVEPNHKDD